MPGRYMSLQFVVGWLVGLLLCSTCSSPGPCQPVNAVVRLPQVLQWPAGALVWVAVLLHICASLSTSPHLLLITRITSLQHMHPYTPPALDHLHTDPEHPGGAS